jgi:hypothetical protein
MDRAKTMLLLGLLSGACISLPATWAGEPAAKLLMGSYIDHMGGFEGEWSLDLDLDRSGRATYTVSTREPGANPSTKKTDIFRGRWEVKADRVTVRFHDGVAETSVEYEITGCLSYVSNTSVLCSPGLQPVTRSSSNNFSLPLWYTVTPRQVSKR